MQFFEILLWIFMVTLSRRETYCVLGDYPISGKIRWPRLSIPIKLGKWWRVRQNRISSNQTKGYYTRGMRFCLFKKLNWVISVFLKVCFPQICQQQNKFLERYQMRSVHSHFPPCLVYRMLSVFPREKQTNNCFSPILVGIFVKWWPCRHGPWIFFPPHIPLAKSDSIHKLCVFLY